MDAPTLLRRLGMVKYIYSVALQDSAKAEPLCATSLLGFHDAIEMVLYAACEHLGAKFEKKLPVFEDYFTALSKVATPPTIAHEVAVKRLNTARNNFKHQGIIPAKTEIEGFRAVAANFLSDNLSPLFGVSLADVSLVHAVEDLESKAFLAEGENLLKAGDVENAARNVSIALRKVIENYHTKTWGANDVDPYELGGDIGPFDIPWGAFSEGREDFDHKVRGTINSLQQVVQIIALGLNYPRYAKFRYLLPTAIPILSGKKDDFHFTIRRTAPALTQTAVQFGIDFAIECALHLQGLRDSI
jgi:hypothetical protein